MLLLESSFRTKAMVLAACIVMLFSGLGSFPLTDRDEGEYAASASEMIKRGDFVVPYLNGRPYLEKPILFFWTLSSSFKTFGQNEFAARLPSALAGLILLASMLFWAGHLSDRSSLGIIASLLLLGSPLFLLVARACLTDMLLTLFIWCSMAFFYAYMEKDRGPFFIWLSWFFLSLGFLTKGPVAVAMCLPTFLLYSFIRRDFSWLRPRVLVSGISLFWVVSLPWYLEIYQRMGKAFVETFFITQNFERFATTLLGHGGGPIYYLAVLAIGLFPYSALLPGLAQRGLPLLYAAVKKRNFLPKDSFFIFCLIASLWIFILLTAAATKQINYIVPALPFLNLCLGVLILEESRASECKIVSKTWLITVSALLLIVTVPWFLFPSTIWKYVLKLIRFDSTEYAFTVHMPASLSFWAFGLFLITILCSFLFLHFKTWKIQRFCVPLFFSGWLIVFFLPTLACMVQCPAKDMALSVKRTILANHKEQRGPVRLTSFGLWKPSMIFYANMPIKRIKTKHPKRLKDALSRPSPCFVFTRTRLQDKLDKIPNFLPIKKWEGYMLGGNEAAYSLFRSQR